MLLGRTTSSYSLAPWVVLASVSSFVFYSDFITLELGIAQAHEFAHESGQRQGRSQLALDRVDSVAVIAHVKRDWVSTAEVAAAAKVSDSTVLKWAARGVLPAYENISKGRRGRGARWPSHALLQAAWVADLMGQGFTLEEVKKALDEGAFKETQES